MDEKTRNEFLLSLVLDYAEELAEQEHQTPLQQRIGYMDSIASAISSARSHRRLDAFILELEQLLRQRDGTPRSMGAWRARSQLLSFCVGMIRSRAILQAELREYRPHG